ncbi:hypothetical protein NY547_14110 [Cnuibacter physcomitrellae]|uniref:hypothetical protein n=1 Tax=Cnuibacter physcomitrellae TaxID=1619308 RepID=UPI0021757633|nr:hypothetical protein [Cnuibacter physcomitrellae]MCS5498382.1 hypothetical protein [Cnuibacter physcomitrellae]
MATAFSLGCLGIGLVLLVIAVGLRLWSLPSWPSTEATSSVPLPSDNGPRISAAARAILVGRPRRAVAAAIADLEAHDAITVRRPAKGRTPEVRIRDIGRVGADAHLLLGPYVTTGSTRPFALWAAIDMVGATLVRKGLTGPILRWPARVLIPLAVIVLILCGFVLLAIAPDPRAWVVAGACGATLAAIVVVPTRIQRPTAAAAPLLAALRPRREAVRRGDHAASAEDAVLFAGAARLRELILGPDGVTLDRLVRSADPGASRIRIVTTTIDALTSWP